MGETLPVICMPAEDEETENEILTVSQPDSESKEEKGKNHAKCISITEIQRLQENENTVKNKKENGKETETDQRREQFYEILERLMRQMLLKQRQEERYKRVDEAIRRHQQSRREAAATTEQAGRKRKKAK